MRCEVEKFVRGTEVTIKKWIVQIQTYFDIDSLKPKFYVKLMLQKIAHLYFKEAVVYKDLQYLYFREKLIKVFGNLDMATARLHDLSRANQNVGDSIGYYMNRMRLPVMRAQPDLTHKERERIVSRTSSSIFATRGWRFCWQLQPSLRRLKRSEELRRVNWLR